MKKIVKQLKTIFKNKIIIKDTIKLYIFFIFREFD